MILTTCIALALQWAPSSDELPRTRVCQTILAATTDDLEQRWLTVVAAEESSFRPRVLDCRTRGDHGRAYGAFQVHPRSPAERKAICAMGVGGVLAALGRMRESAMRCSSLRAELRQTAYAAGWCGSPHGRRISERRTRKVTASLESDPS